MRQTKSLCAESIDFKDITQSQLQWWWGGGTNFSRGTNNVLQYMCKTESLCAENISFKDITRSQRRELISQGKLTENSSQIHAAH